ncbi:hypothetical protein FOCC_FOCC015234 [Frankliniella occidentalis]|nr:hypothetical protein FOCC_FOCC015234 [Frankliniella occidentalis]
MNDVKALSKRCVNVIGATESNQFKNSLYITSINESCNKINKIKLLELRKPLACLKAINNSNTAFLSSDDLADGLHNDLVISKGAKIMLRKNINISTGLVNGAIGIIRHILYDHGQRPPTLPICILIEFESVNLEDLHIKYVPLVPIQSTWYKNGI